MSDRERAKEWIDEISTQEVDRFLYFLNLCLTKRDLYYERCELKQELQRKDNIINEVKELLENPYNQDCVVQNKEILDKIKELEEK